MGERVQYQEDVLNAGSLHNGKQKGNIYLTRDVMFLRLILKAENYENKNM